MRKNEPERNIEGRVVKWARAKGWRAKKMNNLGDRGWPDRLFVGPGVLAFIEFKKPGKDLTMQQAGVIDEIREFGHRVEWFDNSDTAIAWLGNLEAEAVPKKSRKVCS